MVPQRRHIIAHLRPFFNKYFFMLEGGKTPQKNTQYQPYFLSKISLLKKRPCRDLEQRNSVHMYNPTCLPNATLLWAISIKRPMIFNAITLQKANDFQWNYAKCTCTKLRQAFKFTKVLPSSFSIYTNSTLNHIVYVYMKCVWFIWDYLKCILITGY
jgi:hypothetical protein